jgi:hypothetical protein
MQVDKNQAIIDFLMNCPQLANNPLFFNAINAKDDNKEIITQSNDASTNAKYIDGSVLKRFTFTIIDFRSLSYEPIPKVEGHVSENVEDIIDVQAIMDWVNEQADDENYPNFGDTCLIDSMRTTSDNPNLNGVDTQVAPALAKYSMSIQIDYIDTSKAIW